MKSKLTILFSLLVAAFSVIAGEWVFSYHPASAKYAIYGNSLGEPVKPSIDDSKIAFEVTGSAAKEIFDAIAPDRPDQCSSEKGTRFRSRDDEKLSCVRSKKGEYSCYFGFDLKSGKSIGGSIC